MVTFAQLGNFPSTVDRAMDRLAWDFFRLLTGSSEIQASNDSSLIVWFVLFSWERLYSASSKNLD